jgi:GTP-binding protein HflX
LEEVIEADVILHVRDMSHEDSEAQSHDVGRVLAELGVQAGDPRVVEVWNKIDLLGADERVRIFNLAERQQHRRQPIPVSALSGEGIERLLAAIETRLGEKRQTLQLSIDPSDGAGLSWLYRHSEVLSREMRGDGRLALSVRADPKNAEMVKHKYPGTTEVRPPFEFRTKKGHGHNG